MKNLLVLSCLVPVLVLAACQDKKQRRVVLYYSADVQVADPILDEFEKQTGIRVDRVCDSEAAKTVGLFNRLLAEKAKPACDVFWSNEVVYMIQLQRQGLLAPLESPVVANWPEQFRGPEGQWHGFALRQRVIAWSTDRVPDDHAPRSLEDLLAVVDGRHPYRLVMANPQFGTTGGDVASWFAHYGDERTRAILAQLAVRARLVDGNSKAVLEVALNRADIGLTDSDDVFEAREKGWRIGMAPLDQNGRGAMTFPNTVALIRGGPNTEEARLLAEFLLQHAEKRLAESEARNQPIHTIMPDAWHASYGLGKPLDVPYETIVDNLDKARAEAKAVFGR
ncbi:MAG: extracellular solute-binding protein [Phycisphaerae bacterium]|nr:extracellular solute-binding protein [Phycisphaerae bacterium]